MRRPRAAWVATAVAAAAMSSAIATGCDSDDATENQQEAVENALTSDPTGTADRPGTPTGAAGATTAPETGGEEPGAGGSVDASPRDGSGSEVTIPAAPDGLRFTRSSVTATAGTITLKMANPSDNQHNIAVDEPEKAAGPVVGKGGTSTVTVDFPAGRYRYYCSVPGHADAGMVGTLIVK